MAEAIDGGAEIDWGRTSLDYAEHRPGPPESFYTRLLALAAVRPGERLLDLATGTGALALEWAARGCRVAGVDISAAQIDAARDRARAAGLDVRLEVSPVETLPFPDSSFDVLTANQCWLYFDLDRTIPEVCRVLAPGGRLITSHFSFLPRLDPLVQASEALVLRYSPEWSGADWSGRVTGRPAWSRARFLQRAMFCYDEQIPFTRESWRGRMRALRGIGASLPAVEVERFDAEHDTLLREIAPERFDVLHRIDAHVLEPLQEAA